MCMHMGNGWMNWIYSLANNSCMIKMLSNWLELNYVTISKNIQQ